MDIRKNIEIWFPNIVGKPYNIIKTFTFDENIFNGDVVFIMKRKI